MSQFQFYLALGGLKEAGFIREARHLEGTLLILTPQGRESVEMFACRIRASQTEKLNANAPAWKRRIRDELQMPASWQETDNGFAVTLRALEGGAEIFSMTLTAATKAQAKRFCERIGQAARRSCIRRSWSSSARRKAKKKIRKACKETKKRRQKAKKRKHSTETAKGARKKAPIARARRTFFACTGEIAQSRPARARRGEGKKRSNGGLSCGKFVKNGLEFGEVDRVEKRNYPKHFHFFIHSDIMSIRCGRARNKPPEKQPKQGFKGGTIYEGLHGEGHTQHRCIGTRL